MLQGGAATLAAHKEELNALNVFPVADGDTGTNMLMTIEGGLSRLADSESDGIGALIRQFSRSVLLSARGNSGVILSQIFAGIGEGLAPLDTVTARELGEAYRRGIAKSYAAVQNPTEGTILTVFRESTEYAITNLSAEPDIEEFFRLHIEQAERSLAATKDLLPALAEADVVDSGAAGYLYIAKGMYRALCGEEINYEASSKRESNEIDINRFTRDSVLSYGYCTEVLLRLTTAKVNPDAFELLTVLDVLTSLGGESVVAYRDGDIVKVHVHTFTPGEVLNRLQEFGEFLTVKIENMNLGHSEEAPKKPRQSKKFSVVAVATGDGMTALFSQMGADRIISGGQTANPSTEDFLEAFRACESEHIIVLPNNKNIMLAAKQAADIYDGAKVHVLNVKTLSAGYAALSVITPGITDMDTLIESAERAAADVIDGEITVAVRDARVDGHDIGEGEYMAISGGHVLAVAPTAEEGVLKLLEEVDVDLCEIITLFVGKGVDDERRTALTEVLKERYDECEIVVYEGGQDVYDYILAIE